MTIIITPVDAVLLMLISDCKFYTAVEIKAFCEAYGLDKLEVGARIYDLWQEGILKMRESDKVRYALKKSKAKPYQQLATETADKMEKELEAAAVEAAAEPEATAKPDPQPEHLPGSLEEISVWFDNAMAHIPEMMADGTARDLDQITTALGMGKDSKLIVKSVLRQLSRKESVLVRKKAPNGGLYMLRSIYGAVRTKQALERAERVAPVLTLMTDGKERSKLEILDELGLEGAERVQRKRLISSLVGVGRPFKSRWDSKLCAYMYLDKRAKPEPEPQPAFDAETLEKMQSIVLYELRGGVRQAAGELFWLVQSNIPSVRELGANFALLLKEEARKADGLIRYDSESVPSGYALSEAGVAFMGQQPPTPEALRARQYAENLMRPPARPGLNQALAKPYLPAVHSGLVEVMQCGSEQRVVLKGQLHLTLRAAAALRDELQRLWQPFSFWRQYAYGGGMIKETTSIKGVEFTTNELEHVLRRLNAMNFPNN